MHFMIFVKLPWVLFFSIAVNHIEPYECPGLRKPAVCTIFFVWAYDYKMRYKYRSFGNWILGLRLHTGCHNNATKNDTNLKIKIITYLETNV